MKSNRTQFGLFLSVILLGGIACRANSNAVWQWSVPAPSIEGRRAFLWIPPECKQVRGLMVAVQNMLEEPLMERAEFRKTCSDLSLGLVLVYSGHDQAPEDGKNPNHPKRSSLDIFLNPEFPKGGEDPQSAGADLQAILDKLADESGYTELRYAPLIPIGHSSAGSFVWHMSRWNPKRFFAIMPFKTGVKSDGPQGIPIFNIESEWFDYGNFTRNVSSKPSDIQGALKARANGDNSLFGSYIDLGAGHCNVSDDSIAIISLFLKKVMAARIPENAPVDRPIALNPVKTESGWLIDPHLLGSPEGKPIAYADWKGDPKQAYWYLDQELADAVQNHMRQQMAKKPQQINFLKDGVPSTAGGTFNVDPIFLDDFGTFKVQADFIDHMTNTDMYPADYKFDMTKSPILYRVNSGGLVQVGPDTFRVCPRSGPLLPQGNPWEPTLVAYTLGNDQFQPTERPAHVRINIVNKTGAAQTLEFSKFSDQSADHLSPIKLTATASSGLPAQFFMVSGPASIDGDVLAFDKIPARAKFPIHVVVAAFQWGRPADPKVQSVGPIVQDFIITAPATARAN